MRTSTLIAAVMAVALAFLTGWVQIFFGDLNLALLAAMGFSLIVALISPRRVWIWGLLIGLAPGIAELYMMARGLPVQRGAVQMSFAALLPAFVGAYGGYFLRRMVASLFTKNENYAAETLTKKFEKDA